MSKKKKQQTSEPADDGLKGPTCTYYYQSEYKWNGNDKEGYYSIDNIHPCRVLDSLYSKVGVSVYSRNEAKYRKGFLDACWYWLTPDIARAWLDKLIDELGVLLWNLKYSESKLAGIPEREWQTVADKALLDFMTGIPTAPTIFDKPKGRR